MGGPATLKQQTPRVVPLKPLQTTDVYIDAAGNGHLGVFITINGSFPYAHSHAPEWFRRLNLRIYELETRDTILAILMVATMAKNATIILCVVNNGTQNALIGGNSTSQVVAQIVSTF